MATTINSKTEDGRRFEDNTLGEMEQTANLDGSLTFIGRYELLMSGTTIYHIYDIVGGGTVGSQGNKDVFAALLPSPRTADLSFRVSGGTRGITLCAYMVYGGTTNPGPSWGDTIYCEEHFPTTQTDLTIIKFRCSSADTLCLVTLWA